MDTVFEVCQKLEKDMQKDNPIYLSFYHFLKFFRSPDQSVNINTIDAYFRRMYAFEFWRKENKHLQTQIKKILSHHLSEEGLNKIYQSSFFHHCQLLTLKQKSDWLAVANRYAENKKIHYKFIEPDHNSLYVHYQPDGGKHILQRLYPHCYINNGQLFPLTTDEVVYFDSDIKLEALQNHLIYLNNYSYIRLDSKASVFTGMVFKGYTLFPSEKVKVENLNENSRIYYTVKRLEALITGLNDNQTYQKLCDLLEKSLDLLKSGHPESVKLAFAALERGKNAQQSTFPNDKLLQVLIKELSFHLNKSAEGSLPNVDAIK
tara:strand:- start:19530 stop:20483 length:954 start_codon:yes stop_codon:yes gene_type:complete